MCKTLCMQGKLRFASLRCNTLLDSALLEKVSKTIIKNEQEQIPLAKIYLQLARRNNRGVEHAGDLTRTAELTD
jgi:hypothetical protein